MKNLKKPHNLHLTKEEYYDTFGRGKVWYVLDFGIPALEPKPFTYHNEPLNWIDGFGDLFKNWWNKT